MVADEGGAGVGMAPRRWRVAHAVAAFGAGLAASLAAAGVVWSGGITAFESFAVVGAAQTLVTIGVVAWLRRARGREPLGLRPRARDASGLLLGAALAVGLSLITYAVMRLFGFEATEQEVVQIADEAAGLGTQAAVAIVAVLLAPLAEELVFRGVLLKALQGRLSPQWSGLVSAAAFALVHLALDPNALAAVPSLFVVGLVLAATVRRTGGLGFAIATHTGFNLVGVAALLMT